MLGKSVLDVFKGEERMESPWNCTKLAELFMAWNARAGFESFGKLKLIKKFYNLICVKKLKF
jgi:hypothetical protein